MCCWSVCFGQTSCKCGNHLHVGEIHASGEGVAAHENGYSALPHTVDNASALLLGERAAVPVAGVKTTEDGPLMTRRMSEGGGGTLLLQMSRSCTSNQIKQKMVAVDRSNGAMSAYSCKKRATLCAPSTVEENTTVTRPCIFSKACTSTTSLSSDEHTAMYLAATTGYNGRATARGKSDALAQLIRHLEPVTTPRRQK